MEIKRYYQTGNACYKANVAGKYGKITPAVKIIVHSTGAENKTLRRYVAPDDGVIGRNQYDNDWNRSSVQKMVHAMIGEDKNGVVRCYQLLPWEYCCWGCGTGSKGSYNFSPRAIQFEICEGSATDKAYFDKAYNMAAQLCAYLIKQYGITVNDVISHAEAYKLGYASDHDDADAYFKVFGRSMKDFRALVLRLLTGDNDDMDDGIKAKSTAKISTLDASGAPEKNRYIGKGDTCRILRITDNVLIEVEYPLAVGGTRTAYVRDLSKFKAV